MIYLASAYSHQHWFVRELRYRMACREVAKMLQEGKVAFSPIVFGHPLTRLGLPTGWDFWRRFNTECLMRCDELHVLLFGAWEEKQRRPSGDRHCPDAGHTGAVPGGGIAAQCAAPCFPRRGQFSR